MYRLEVSLPRSKVIPSAVMLSVNVVTPENVAPARVETPETTKELVFTSAVLPALTVTVANPAFTADMLIPVPKLIVCAVPTEVPLLLTPIPAPTPLRLVSPEPSPLKVPVMLIFPFPLIVLLLRSKLPPNCGVVSSTTFDIPEEDPLLMHWHQKAWHLLQDLKYREQNHLLQQQLNLHLRQDLLLDTEYMQR